MWTQIYLHYSHNCRQRKIHQLNTNTRRQREIQIHLSRNKNTNWTQIHPSRESNTNRTQIHPSREYQLNAITRGQKTRKIYWREMNAGKDRNTKWHNYMQAKIEISSEHKYTQAKIEIPRQIQSWVSVGVDFLVELCYTWIIGTPTASPRLCQSRSCTSSSLDGREKYFSQLYPTFRLE